MQRAIPQGRLDKRQEDTDTFSVGFVLDVLEAVKPFNAVVFGSAVRHVLFQWGHDMDHAQQGTIKRDLVGWMSANRVYRVGAWDIDLWFKNKEDMYAFHGTYKKPACARGRGGTVEDVEFVSDLLPHGDRNNYSRCAEGIECFRATMLHRLGEDDITRVSVDLVVHKELPVNDFDVNGVVLDPNAEPLVPSDKTTLDPNKTVEDVMRRVQGKTASVLPAYRESFLRLCSEFEKAKASGSYEAILGLKEIPFVRMERMLSGGWTLVLDDATGSLKSLGPEDAAPMYAGLSSPVPKKRRIEEGASQDEAGKKHGVTIRPKKRFCLKIDRKGEFTATQLAELSNDKPIVSFKWMPGAGRTGYFEIERKQGAFQLPCEKGDRVVIDIADEPSVE